MSTSATADGYNEGILQREIPEARAVTRYINIDSRDRDRTRYRNTNDYEVTLRDPLFAVKHIELVSAEIPKSEYFLDASNNLVEMLIDPVLFASNNPPGRLGNIKALHVRDNLVQVLYINRSSTNGHGLVYTLRASTTTATSVSGSSTFNASSSSDLSAVIMTSNVVETITLVAYSETEVNSTGSCRIIVTKYTDALTAPTQISFGGEFSFGVTAYEKRLVPLDTRRFALMYNFNNTEVRIRVGSTGVDLSDTDTRVSNAIAFSNGTETVLSYMMARINATRALVAFSAQTSTVYYCKAIVTTVDASFTTTVGTPVQIGGLYSSPVLSVSCAVLSTRGIVAYVVQSTLYIGVLRIVANDIAVGNFTTYSDGSFGSVSSVSLVSPLAHVVWPSDALRTFRVQVRQVSEQLKLYVDGSTTAYTALSLAYGERYRFVLEKHPLEEGSVDLTAFNFYVSEASTVRYTATVSGLGTASVLIDVPQGQQTLYYGLASASERGSVSFAALSGSYMVPFTVFHSGTHDVGILPYTERSSTRSAQTRLYRADYSQIGDVVHSVSGSHAGVALVVDRGEVWMYDGTWSFVSGGGDSSTRPNAREGAMGAVSNGVMYLFGGLGRVTTPTRDSSYQSRFSVIHEGDDVVVKHVRNARTVAHPMYFYQVEFTDSYEKFTFHSAVGPDVTAVVSGVGSWTNVVDLSVNFSRSTYGLRVASNVPVSTVYALPVDTGTYSPTGWGLGPNAATAVAGSISGYTFSVLLWPHLVAVDNDGGWDLSTMSVTVEIRRGESVLSTRSARIAVDEWTALAVTLAIADWLADGGGATLSDVNVRVTANSTLMGSGYLAIRDPEFFVDEVRLASAQRSDATLDVTFTAYNETDDADEISSTASSTYASTVTAGRGGTAGAVYRDDLWSFVVDPNHARLAVAVRLHGTTVSNITASRIVPALASGTIFLTAAQAALGTSQYLSMEPWAVVDAGESLIDGASIYMRGAAIALPSSGALLREVGTGDFALLATARLQPMPHIVFVDASTVANLSNATLGLYAPATVANASVNTSLFPGHLTSQSQAQGQRTAAPFVSGGTLTMANDTLLLYTAVALPSTYQVCFYIYVPNTSTGDRRIFRFTDYYECYVTSSGHLGLKRNDEIEYTDVSTLGTTQWVHVCVRVSGEAVGVHLNNSGTPVVTGLCARPQTTNLEVGQAAGAWFGTMTMSAFCVYDSTLTPANAAVVCQHHYYGSVGGSRQCIMSTPLSGFDFGVFVRNEVPCVIVGTIGTTSVQVTLPNATDVVDVAFVRSSGTATLTVSGSGWVRTASANNTTSLELANGDTTIGATQYIATTLFYGTLPGSYTYTDVFAGALDEVRLLPSYSAALFATDKNGDRRRPMTWQTETITNASSEDGFTPLLTARAFGGCTTDEDQNIWLFGGESLSGTCSDLWTFANPYASGEETTVAATHLNGSSVGLKAVGASHPGSRAHMGFACDGQRLYAFGGEITPSVGPFVIQASVSKIYRVAGSADAEVADLIFDHSSSPLVGFLFPVYVSRYAVLADAADVIWLDATIGGTEYSLFMLPDEGDEYVRLSTSEAYDTLLPAEHLVEGDKAASLDRWSTQQTKPPLKDVLSDLWMYDISALGWTLLSEGTGTRTISNLSTDAPGPRSRVNLHAEASSPSAIVNLMSGHHIVSGHGVATTWDVWTASEASGWAWSNRRLGDGTAPAFSVVYNGGATSGVQTITGLSRAGESRAPFWVADGLPNVLSFGNVFTNQLQGEVVESNSQYGVALQGVTTWTVGADPTVQFQRRDTFAAVSIYPGELSVLVVPEINADRYILAYLGTLAHISIGTPVGVTYDADSTTGIEQVDIDVLGDNIRANGVPDHTLRLVMGITYRFKTTETLIFTLGGSPYTPTTIPQGYAVDTAGLSGTFSITISGVDGSISASVELYSTVEASLPIAESGSARQILGNTTATFASLVPNAQPLLMDMAIASATSTTALATIAYQDGANNRYGTVLEIEYDTASNVFSLSAGPAVFKAFNPTTALAVAPALFSRSIVAAVADTGLSCVLTKDGAIGTSVLASEATVTQTRAVLLNKLATNPLNGLWFLSFVYNGTGRVLVQRSVSDQLAAPLQNLIGETILYTNPLTIQATANPGFIDMAKFATGARSGDVVCIYGQSNGELRYQDIATLQSDPAVSNIAPTPRTVPFDLVNDPLRVATGVGQAKVATTGYFSSSASSFVAVYVNTAGDAMYVRRYTHVATSYTAGVQHALPVGEGGSIVLESAEERPSTLGYLLVRYRRDATVHAILVSLAQLVADAGGDLVTTNDMSLVFDNTNAVLEHSSVVLASPLSIVCVSVHNGATVEVAPVTVRSLGTDASLLTSVIERPTYKGYITPGDYGLVTDFITELQAVLRTIDPFFTVTYNSGTTKAVIKNSFSPFRILLSTALRTPTNEQASNGLAYILGFRDFEDIVPTEGSDGFSVTSDNRIDVAGRQFLYLFLSCAGQYLSSEATSRNKKDAFGRIVLAVSKGSTMYFMNSAHYTIEASVDVPVMNHVRVQLGRFSQLSSDLDDDVHRDLLLYEPQGVEHSFSMKVWCNLDKIGSSGTPGSLRLTRLPELRPLTWSAGTREADGAQPDSPSSSDDEYSSGAYGD